MLHFRLGYFLSDPGQLDCRKTCAVMNLRCLKSVQTLNKMDLFKRLGVPCDEDASLSEMTYDKSYHPIYYPDKQMCAGYVKVPNIVSCEPLKDEDVSDPQLKSARRICNCVDACKLK